MAGHQSTRITSHADVDLRKARPPSGGEGKDFPGPSEQQRQGERVERYSSQIPDSRFSK